MKRASKFALGAVAALSLGLAASAVNAHPYGNGHGEGMGQGPGYGQGYGPGPGMGQGMGRGAMMGHGPMGYGHMGQGPMGQGPMGQGPMGQGPMGPGHMGRGMGPQGGNPSAMADARNAYFKSELNITPAQESAWKAYAEQRKQQVVAMQALRASAQGSAQATAPERLELRSQMMKKRQEQMERVTAAFKDLYASLSPEQKALADQRVGLGMMGGRGMAFSRPGR